MTKAELSIFVAANFDNGAKVVGDTRLQTALETIITLLGAPETFTAAVKSSSATGGIGYATGAGGTVSQATFALAGVAIAGTAGQFTCTASTHPLTVGTKVAISGTAGGTGSITGYSDPTTYYIIATNGSTTFTLSDTAGGSAITTTAGTPTGLTYTVSAKSAGVTLNKVSGAITTLTASMAASSSVSFTLTNSTIGANDVVQPSIKSGASTGLYKVSTTATAAGSCQLTIENIGSAAAETVVINYVVIKGVAA